MNGIAFASGMLGAIMVTVPLEVVLRVLHWREVFTLIVGLTVAVSLVLFFVVPEKASARRAPPLPALLREFAALGRDPAFWRMAVCIGASQLTAVSLATLWVATWLRDVLGYTQAEVAQALLLFNISMIAGYLGFGRVADRMTRLGRGTLPLLAGGVAVASLCLGLLVLGARTGAIALWCAFFCTTTAVVLSYSLFSRRYPTEMAGRVNSALNVAVFVGMFSGQWAVGLVLNRWPPTAVGYAPEAYSWALGGLWLVQATGLAWLWAGRRLFR